MNSATVCTVCIVCIISCLISHPGWHQTLLLHLACPLRKFCPEQGCKDANAATSEMSELRRYKETHQTRLQTKHQTDIINSSPPPRYHQKHLRPGHEETQTYGFYANLRLFFDIFAQRTSFALRLAQHGRPLCIGLRRETRDYEPGEDATRQASRNEMLV